MSALPRNIILRLLGPGLVTGAADDDPSGIATYSQAGAQFGYGLLWTVFLTTPFMIAIQLVSAHIGRVTGKGIAANAKQFYPLPLVLVPVGLLVVANTINIAADLAAMGEALYLVIGGGKFHGGRWQSEQSCLLSRWIMIICCWSSRYWAPRSVPIYFFGRPRRKSRKCKLNDHGLDCL